MNRVFDNTAKGGSSPFSPWPLLCLILATGIFSFLVIDPFNLLFLLLALLFYRSGCKDKDLFSPFFLFMPTLFSVMLYWSRIFPYYLPQLLPLTRTWILLGFTAFYLGMQLCCVTSRNQGKEWIPQAPYSLPITLFIGILPYCASIILYGVPLLSKADLSEVRSDFQLPIIGMFFVFMPLAIFIAKSRKQYFKTICLLALALSFIKVTKFDIILTVFVILCSFNSKMNLLRHKHKIIAVATCLFLLLGLPILFQYNYSMRNYNTMVGPNDYFFSERASSTIPPQAVNLVLPYLYFVTPWANLDYCISVVKDHRYGVMTARPFMSITQLKYLFDVDYTKEILNPPFNTHSYLTDFYYDFGIFGVVFLSFFLGVLVNWIYLRSRMTDDPALKAEYGILGIAVIMMFFSNHFTSGYPIVTFVLFESYRALNRWVVSKSYA